MILAMYRVLDSNFNDLAIFDHYQSMIWTQRNDQTGDFEVYTPIDKNIMRYLRVGNYLFSETFYDKSTDRAHLMLIESIEIVSSNASDQADSYKATGRSLKSILDRRIVWNKTNFVNGSSVYNAIKTLFHENIVDPVKPIYEGMLITSGMTLRCDVSSLPQTGVYRLISDPTLSDKYEIALTKTLIIFYHNDTIVKSQSLNDGITNVVVPDNYQFTYYSTENIKPIDFDEDEFENMIVIPQPGRIIPNFVWEDTNYAWPVIDSDSTYETDPYTQYLNLAVGMVMKNTDQYRVYIAPLTPGDSHLITGDMPDGSEVAIYIYRNRVEMTKMANGEITDESTYEITNTDSSRNSYIFSLDSDFTDITIRNIFINAGGGKRTSVASCAVIKLIDYVDGKQIQGLQYDGDNLYEAIANLASNYKLSYEVVYEFKTSRLIFRMIKPVDHSYEQTENPVVVFSTSFNNLLNSSYTEDSTTYRNVAKVVYGTDGSDGMSELVLNEATGLERREVYYDATSDISEETSKDDNETDTGDMTQIIPLMNSKAQEALNKEYAYTKLYDGEADNSTNFFVYGVDYNIGDIVHIITDFGYGVFEEYGKYESKAVVAEMILSESTSGITLIPTFRDVETKEVTSVSYSVEQTPVKKVVVNDINSATKDGLVTKGSGNPNKVWKTDSNGVPAWREDDKLPENPLSIAHGGTGQTTAANGFKALADGLDVANLDPLDSTYFITDHATSETKNGKYYRRAASKVWNWIKSKIIKEQNPHPIFYGTSSTAAGTVAKVVALTNTPYSTGGRTLSDGDVIVVSFSNVGTSNSGITLNVDGTGARSVMFIDTGGPLPENFLGYSARKYMFTYSSTADGGKGSWYTTYTKTVYQLRTARTIQTNLASTASASFDGTANVTPGVTGTLPIANGGTGATTRLGAGKNLTNEAVASPGYVVGLTNNWANFGYTTLAQLKTAMSLNNVNNTADANKSVNVADYAAYAGPLAHFGGTSSYGNQYIKIKINSTTSWMLVFTVTLYQGYRATKLMISGYNYGNSHWYTPLAKVISDTSETTYTVYFGYDSVWNLWVAFPGGSYTGVSVDEVVNGYTQVGTFNKLFTISAVSSLTTIQTTFTARSYAVYANSAGSASSAGNSDTVDGYHAGNYTSLATANVIPARTTNGDIYVGRYAYVTYLNQGSGAETNALSYVAFFDSSGWLRKGSGAHIRNSIGLGNTTGALPVANGGTGSTTAAGARTNLGLGDCYVPGTTYTFITHTAAYMTSANQTIFGTIPTRRIFSGISGISSYTLDKIAIRQGNAYLGGTDGNGAVGKCYINTLDIVECGLAVTIKSSAGSFGGTNNAPVGFYINVRVTFK